MDALVISVAYILIWRLAVLACGLVCIILGYHLFKIGFSAQDGALEAGMAGNSVKISNIAPGTFFALFGAAIITTLVWTAPTEITIPKEFSQNTGAVDTGKGGLTVRGD